MDTCSATADKVGEQNNTTVNVNGGIAHAIKSKGGPISSHAISACSSWASTTSPSLALRATISTEDDETISQNATMGGNESNTEPTLRKPETPTTPPHYHYATTKCMLTAERKRWIQQTLIDYDNQSYTTRAREECCKNQNRSDLASERRRWVEQTLLNNKYTPTKSAAREEMCQNQYNTALTSERKRWIESTLLNKDSTSKNYGSSTRNVKELKGQLSLSVAERRQWLSGVTRVKSAAELEEEVRLEARRLKEAAKKAKEEEEARKRAIELEEEVRLEARRLKEAAKKAKEEEEARKQAIELEEAVRLEATRLKEAAKEAKEEAAKEAKEEAARKRTIDELDQTKGKECKSLDDNIAIVDKMEETIIKEIPENATNPISSKNEEVAAEENLEDDEHADIEDLEETEYSISEVTCTDGKRKKRKLGLKRLIRRLTPSKSS